MVMREEECWAEEGIEMLIMGRNKLSRVNRGLMGNAASL